MCLVEVRPNQNHFMPCDYAFIEVEIEYTWIYLCEIIYYMCLEYRADFCVFWSLTTHSALSPLYCGCSIFINLRIVLCIIACLLLAFVCSTHRFTV